MSVTPVRAGDLAEYVGGDSVLRGQRCEVERYSSTGKRVRTIWRYGQSGTAVRWVKPENLKQVRGG